MASVSPFHSKKSPGVYHTCSNCTAGNNIKRKNKAPGRGGGTLCQRCAQLRRNRKCQLDPYAWFTDLPPYNRSIVQVRFLTENPINRFVQYHAIISCFKIQHLSILMCLRPITFYYVNSQTLLTYYNYCILLFRHNLHLRLKMLYLMVTGTYKTPLWQFCHGVMPCFDINYNSQIYSIQAL